MRAVARPLAVLGAALAALLALAPPAGAGSVRVSQCRASADGPWTPAAFQASAWWAPGGWPEVDLHHHASPCVEEPTVSVRRGRRRTVPRCDPTERAAKGRT